MHNADIILFCQRNRRLLSLILMLCWICTVKSNAQRETNADAGFSKYEKKSVWNVSRDLVEKYSARRPANNFDETKVPNYTLPDIFTQENGKKVTTALVWEQERRSELLTLFRSEVYGLAPPKPDNLAFRIVESDPKAMEGKATLKRIAISFHLQGEPFTFHLTLFVPNQREGKSPVFLLLNHRSVDNTDPTRKTISDYWPAEYVIERGYAIAAITCAVAAK